MVFFECHYRRNIRFALSRKVFCVAHIHTTRFCAYGHQASHITDSNHSLGFGLGEGSPLARIYFMIWAVSFFSSPNFQAWVIIAIRLMHFATEVSCPFLLRTKRRSGGCHRYSRSAGSRRWTTFENIDWIVQI